MDSARRVLYDLWHVALQHVAYSRVFGPIGATRMSDRVTVFLLAELI